MENKRVDWVKVCRICQHFKNGCGGHWSWHFAGCDGKNIRGRKEFADVVCEIFDELKALYMKKAEQYAQGDPLANFRGGAALQGLNPESLDDCFKVLLGYDDKHIAFVHQSGKLGPKVEESLGDNAVYSIIGMAMCRIKRGEW